MSNNKLNCLIFLAVPRFELMTSCAVKLLNILKDDQCLDKRESIAHWVGRSQVACRVIKVIFNKFVRGERS
jgi:hypothetical protein